MTDVLLQTYIPTVATLMLVGIGILFNNSKLSDLNTTLNKRIDDLRADANTQSAQFQNRFGRVEEKLDRVQDQFGKVQDQFGKVQEQYSRLESVMVGKLSEVEARLARIESHLNIE